MKKLLILISIIFIFIACEGKPEYAVDKSKCTGCWKCMKKCPNNMIVKDIDSTDKEAIKETARIRTERCVGCGKCYKECNEVGSKAIYCVDGTPDIDTNENHQEDN
ncbi:MAG: 4Fe-4S dicluster domain [Bacteroidetes bacterium]|nr:4Fe-4S dicluster domain [Bacteroidota bacterium]